MRSLEQNIIHHRTLLVDEGDKAKIAFSTSWGHYEYNVMPFGLKGASTTFQRLMTKVLSPYLYDFVMVYFDDIIIFFQTMDEHLQHMRKVLEALRQVGLKLKLEKCEFAKKQLKYLGFIVGEFGIKPNPEKVRAIVDQPALTNQTQIRSFLGMIGFFRNHIQGFSTIAVPIMNLLAKEVPYMWGQEQQQAFERLKQIISSVPVLVHLDFNRSFILYTDASKEGLEAILAQEGQDKRIHPVTFISYKNNRHERNYSITDLKGLAVFWAVKKLKRYLKGTPFTIVMDHSALKYIFTKEEILEGKRGQWMIYLQQFDFKIEHRAGKKMPHVDYLSRSPLEQSMVHHPEELTKETFVEQVCVSRKTKYVIAFIYNAYGPWMSVRIDRRKEMYGLHQSPGRAIETQDSNSLETALRELREETGLRIHQSRPKWIGYDPKYDCDIYAIELNIGENPQWIEQDKMGPWGIIPWDMYINMAA